MLRGRRTGLTQAHYVLNGRLEVRQVDTIFARVDFAIYFIKYLSMRVI